MKELLFCNYRAKRKNDQIIVLNPVGGGVLRRSSTRSTRANCSTITMAANGDSWDLRRRRFIHRMENIDVSWLTESTDEVTDSSGLYTVSTISKMDLYG